MLNEAIGAILQILIFGLIPFLVYVIQHKTTKGFFEYVGLKRSTRKANYLGVAACLLFAGPVLILVWLSPEFREIMYEPTSITGKFRAMGFSSEALVILLVMAVFKTSFSEELLFRGFIAKRFVQWLGFKSGNLIQASIFGIIHTILFAFITSYLPFLILIFVVPTAGAYISVYLNEKIANGSIIPGWISHALANILAYGIVGFVI